MKTDELVASGTILRATVGSTVHGLHHGGQDDRDEMAVFVEPPEYLVGLARARGIRGGLYGFEHYVERTQPEGVRSGPGDLDLVAYSLRKYVRLALKGHPTILLLLTACSYTEAFRVRGGIGLRLHGADFRSIQILTNRDIDLTVTNSDGTVLILQIKTPHPR